MRIDYDYGYVEIFDADTLGRANGARLAKVRRNFERAKQEKLRSMCGLRPKVRLLCREIIRRHDLPGFPFMVVVRFRVRHGDPAKRTRGKA